MSRIACLPGFTVVPAWSTRAAVSRAASVLLAAFQPLDGCPSGSILGQATRTAVQAEREPSSLMARNINPASTLEDPGQT
jgi:hypothetical protein